MKLAKKAIKLAVVLVCAAAILCTVSGCRATDALKEIVYLQTAETVDYDNPKKFYINDSTATETSDEVSASETDTGKGTAEEVQNLVVYGSKPNTKDITAKKSAFSDNPDFKGIEASESVFFYKSNDKDAVKHAVTKVEEKKDDDKKEQDDSAPATTVGTSGQKKQQETDKGEGGSGDKKTQEETPDKKESTGASEDETVGKKARKADPTRVTYDSSDPSQEPPKVEKVAAFGEYAVIVQMIAGKGALVATDAETLKSDFSKVFDTSGIAQGWSDGGSAKKMNVKKIVDSGAQVILTSDAAYLESLSNADFGKLTKAKIEVVVLRPMTCSQYIKSNVTTVGNMLDGSKAGEYGSKAVDRAKAYSEFHDRVVGACVSASGGKLAGSKVFQSSGKDDLKKDTAGDDKSTFTLLVDGYDKDATYNGASLGANDWKPSKGLAYSSAGYTSTPVSYYIQCGGLVNNVADISTKTSTGSIPLWQFNNNVFGFSSKDWSGITVSLASDKAIKNLGRPLLDCGKNASNRTGLGAGFGTESFPKMIATSESVKSGLIANSKKSNGSYAGYGWVSAEGSDRNIEAFGVNLGNSILFSTVGVNGTESGSDAANPMADGFPEDSIVVNPHGLFCSWTQGSVESFLEAAWVSDEVNDNADGVDWKKEAKDFYKTFYGYDLTTSDLTD